MDGAGKANNTKTGKEVCFACVDNAKFRSDQRCGLHKTRDKLNNLVMFDKGTYDQLYKEVPTHKLITPSIVSEKPKFVDPSPGGL